MSDQDRISLQYQYNIKQASSENREQYQLGDYEWLTNRTSAKRESDLFITSMITDRIKRHEVLLSINQD